MNNITKKVFDLRDKNLVVEKQGCYSPVKCLTEEGIQIVDALLEEGYDTVVLSYEGRDYWGNKIDPCGFLKGRFDRHELPAPGGWEWYKAAILRLDDGYSAWYPNPNPKRYKKVEYLTDEYGNILDGEEFE